MEQAQTLRAWLDGVTLEVEDVERSKEFYQRIPGVVLEMNLPPEFILLRMGDFHIGLLKLGSPGLPEGISRGFHLEALTKDGDLDELHKVLGDAGVKALGPPKEQRWGERTFEVIDPDGNHIEFGGQ
jgi:catechol 2,3-dioxygenase-like lactoylglutathione lyase family enzyme